MRESDTLLEDARTCFRHAAGCRDVKSMTMFADIGRQYLQMAHEAADFYEQALGRSDQPNAAIAS